MRRIWPAGRSSDLRDSSSARCSTRLKAFDGDILVDLVFRPAGGPIDDACFERATPIEVSSLTVPVASIDDVLVAKLLALNGQDPDFRAVLEVARALREQIDWGEVEDRSCSSPFARAFFTLGEGLGIIERQTVLAPAHSGRSVRVKRSFPEVERWRGARPPGADSCRPRARRPSRGALVRPARSRSRDRSDTSDP